jgi:DNA-binding MarR family transcriptional regulator
MGQAAGSVATAGPDADVNGTPQPSLARHASLGYQVNHLGRLLAQALRNRIGALGVVPGQFAQLLALFEQDGLTQTELCQRVRIEQPTMANTLNRMERDGLVRRVPDPVDGRRARVMLTPRARRLEPALTSAARSVNADAMRGIGDREVAAFMATLARMIDNLEAVEPAG